MFLMYCLVLFLHRVSVSSHNWPEIHNVGQARGQFTDLPVSASGALGLKACANTLT